MENVEGNTVLHEAAKHDSNGVVFLLMRTDRHLMLAANKAGASALYVAAEEGIVKTTERILAAMKKIPDAYWGGPNGRNPLHAAVIRGHIGKCLTFTLLIYKYIHTSILFCYNLEKIMRIWFLLFLSILNIMVMFVCLFVLHKK